MSKNDYKNQIPQTSKVEMPSLKEEKVPESLDESIDDFVLNVLQPFHALLSKHSISAKDVDIDLACDKIAQTMTALQKRSKTRREKGTYGKE